MTILVAYVPRPEGQAALDKAIELARKNDEPLVVVNAGRGGHQDDPSLAVHVDIEHVEKQLQEAKVKGEVKQFVRGKSAVEEIDAMVNALRPSVLVIGLRPRTAVGKLILGSVAQELLLTVSCPVLAVKAG